MLTVSVEKKGQSTLAILDGQIDETFNLEQELANPEGTLDLNLAKVNRINSIGVKKWMLFLQTTAKRAPIRFLEVSPALVEQFNMISNFGASGKIFSIQLPYECKACQNTFRVTKKCDDLVQTQGKLGKEKCPKCGAHESEFDDVPEEYLHFLHLK